MEGNQAPQTNETARREPRTLPNRPIYIRLECIRHLQGREDGHVAESDEYGAAERGEGGGRKGKKGREMVWREMWTELDWDGNGNVEK